MKLLNNERGSAVVLVALSMVVFLSVLALVADVGLYYLKRTQLQNALDAAILAGAQELPSRPLQAKQITAQYASDNGIDPNTLNIQVALDGQKISVTAENDVKFNFAQIMGISQGSVQARSFAKLAPVRQVTGVVPLAIEEQQFDFGTQYALKIAHPDHGWCGALALGGNGASTYEDNLANGYQHPIKIGDILDTKSGNMSGPTKKGIEARFDRELHTPCSATSYQRDCPRIVTIPVVSSTSVQGNVKSVTVVGFAAFLIDNVPGNGNESIISGTFIQAITNGDIGDTGPSFGLNGVKLTRE